MNTAMRSHMATGFARPDMTIRQIQPAAPYRPFTDRADIIELSLVTREGAHEPLTDISFASPLGDEWFVSWHDRRWPVRTRSPGVGSRSARWLPRWVPLTGSLVSPLLRVA